MQETAQIKFAVGKLLWSAGAAKKETDLLRGQSRSERDS